MVTVVVFCSVPHSVVVVQTLSGYLQLNGLRVQRACIRTALVTADPSAAATGCSRTVARRAYHVSASISLWHIDSHLKLIWWAQLIFVVTWDSLHSLVNVFQAVIFFHWHTRPFNGPFSRTTRVSRYQKGKTNLDFTEARDSEWQWHQLGHMQVCTLLQTDNHASTPPLRFLQAGCPSCRPTNSVKALKANFYWNSTNGKEL